MRTPLAVLRCPGPLAATVAALLRSDTEGAAELVADLDRDQLEALAHHVAHHLANEASASKAGPQRSHAELVAWLVDQAGRT